MLLKLLIFLIVTAFSQAALAENINVAVTVDDLPNHSAVPNGTSQMDVARKMLAVFKKHRVPEVYGFTNAGKLKEDPGYYKILKEWANQYPLGNHSFTHKSIDKVSIEEFKKEISSNEATLKKYNKGQNWKVFRYPFLREGNSLERRNAIRKFLFDQGYQIAQVTIDFEDWSWNQPYTRCKNSKRSDSMAELKKSFIDASLGALERAEAVAKVLYEKPIQHILLLHMGAFDAEMLDEMLTAYEKKGVKFIPLNEAMRDPIYKHDPQYVKDAGSEFIYQVMRERGIKSADLKLPTFLDYQEQLQKTCI